MSFSLGPRVEIYISIRSCFLIEKADTMGRLFLVEYNKDPFLEYFQCIICRLRVAFLEDRILNVPDSTRGIFNKVFNVEVPDDERYHQELNGNTVADAYCVQCGELLGCKLIAVPEPSMYYREGRFVMRLEKLICGNDQDESDNEQDHGEDNEQNDDDQEAGADQVADGIDNVDLNADI
ncbi:PREDICTED: protein yippee-like At3g08990 [Nicotiana attenuata]|uniref:protein yippee-like At3g08990 n=1 Tax=Nicotiana attenuata TaxID=49451 RepID=UPI000905C2F0|nr:PREDICTED: protein yippee-like At3g08990 [Nicotiana attenuata]